jgi:hypothetical protein
MFGSERRRRGISHHSTALELQFHEDMRPFLVDLREHFYSDSDECVPAFAKRICNENVHAGPLPEPK